MSGEHRDGRRLTRGAFVTDPQAAMMLGRLDPRTVGPEPAFGPEGEPLNRAARRQVKRQTKRKGK